MDLDAEVKKIRSFIGDMHALFPGGAEGLKDAAARVRAGEPMRQPDGQDAPAALPDDLMGRVEEALALGDRMNAMMPQLENAIETMRDIADHVTELANAVSELQKAADTPKDAVVGATETHGATARPGAADPAARQEAAPAAPETQDPSAQGSG